MAAAKFTYKKEKAETGLAAVGHPYPNTLIKHNKLEVGIIAAPNYMTPDHKWSVRFAFNKDDGFVWKVLKARFDSEPEARSYIDKHAESFLKWDLHHFEAD